jgi:hypothetical protein
MGCENKGFPNVAKNGTIPQTRLMGYNSILIANYRVRQKELPELGGA